MGNKIKVSHAEQYSELAGYTLAHQDPAFIHQHIVDAYTVQAADLDTKPISIAFSLVGLYLYIERNYSGREVQRFHMKMAEHKKEWPIPGVPAKKGDSTISNVPASAPGPDREAIVRTWCASIREACGDSRETGACPGAME